MKRLLLLAMTLLLFVSCYRKPLEDPYKYLAYIPITIDWSLSQLDEDYITNVSIYFYPEDGGEPTVKISDNIYFNVVHLPVGTYSVLIMNEMVGDVDNVNHYDENSYVYMSANAIEELDEEPRYYTMSSTDRLLKQHERVAAWSLDKFVVDEDMVQYTRTDEFEDYIETLRSKATKSSGMDNGAAILSLLSEISTPTTELVSTSIEKMVWVQPLPITTIVDISARVLNLNSAMYIECVLKGTASGSILCSDTPTWPSSKTNIYDFFITNRSYDDPTNGIDGNIGYTLNTFGRKFEDESYIVDLNIILQTGELMNFTYDVTDQVKKYDGKRIYIDLTSGDGGGGEGGDDDDDDVDTGGGDKTPIELPEFGVAGFDVNPWGDVVVIPL